MRHAGASRHARASGILALLALLMLLTACSLSQGNRPAATPATAPDSTSAKAAPTPVSSSPALPPVEKPAGGQSTRPAIRVGSSRRAFALVRRTQEVQEVSRRLGPRFTMVNTASSATEYQISVGESFPDGVRFELYFQVSKADGAVRYTDPMSGQVKLATPLSTERDPLANQAVALMNRGDAQGAIVLLTQAVTARPTAENWNELSYAYIRASRWQEALDAGRKALELDEFHPFALYNTGMAALELKKYGEAILDLRETADLQPDRHEPYQGLARAYQATGRYALAVDAMSKAVRLAPGDPSVVRLQAALAGMVVRTAPPDLAETSRIRLEDSPYSLYLYPNKATGSTVFLAGPGGVVGLPVGDLHTEAWNRFEKVALPGGATGYLLSGPPVGAYVSRSTEWRLFVRQGSQFRQMIFVGDDEAYVQPVSDFLRSARPPALQGDRLVASYGNDASGKDAVVVTRQLLLEENRANLLEITYENRNPRK